MHVYAIPTLLSLFHIMYKTKVIDRKYVPKKGPFIIMSNHRSHMDEFFIGFSAFPTFFRPFYYPADVKLWKNPFFKPILEGMNCVPVFKKLSGKKHATSVIYKMIHIVNSGGSIMYFPEGARKKPPYNGKLQPGKLGAGWLAYETKVRIIPAAIKNTEVAMPLGKPFTFGDGPRKIKLVCKFGPPINLKKYYRLEGSPQTSKLITESIMQEISSLFDSIKDVK